MTFSQPVKMGRVPLAGTIPFTDSKMTIFTNANIWSLYFFKDINRMAIDTSIIEYINLSGLTIKHYFLSAW